MTPKVSEGWARIKVPTSFKAGPSGIAQLCDWEFRKVVGEFTDVRTREGYRHLAPTLVSLFKVASVNTADDTTGFDHVGRWWPQDSYDKSGQLAARGMSEVQRLIPRPNFKDSASKAVTFSWCVPTARLSCSEERSR